MKFRGNPPSTDENLLFCLFYSQSHILKILSTINEKCNSIALSDGSKAIESILLLILLILFDGFIQVVEKKKIFFFIDSFQGELSVVWVDDDLSLLEILTDFPLEIFAKV